MTADTPANGDTATANYRTRRIALNREWHDRPDLSMPAPLRCSHLVTLRGESTLEEVRAEFGRLCTEHGQSTPAAGSRYHTVHIGPCLLQWEGHTEADSYTILLSGNGQPPFGETALDFVDKTWRERLQQQQLVE